MAFTIPNTVISIGKVPHKTPFCASSSQKPRTQSTQETISATRLSSFILATASFAWLCGLPNQPPEWKWGLRVHRRNIGHQRCASAGSQSEAPSLPDITILLSCPSRLVFKRRILPVQRWWSISNSRRTWAILWARSNCVQSEFRGLPRMGESDGLE